MIHLRGMVKNQWNQFALAVRLKDTAASENSFCSINVFPGIIPAANGDAHVLSWNSSMQHTSGGETYFSSYVADNGLYVDWDKTKNTGRSDYPNA